MADTKELDDFRKLFERAKSARSQFENDWYLNAAYFVGDQWVFWNRDRLDRPNVAKNRVLLVDNRIMGVVGTRIARKVKQRPTFVATPFSADQSDLESAELSEKVLENDWQDLQLTRKLFSAELWAEICTAGFWKVYYDKDKGDKETFIVGGDGSPMIGDDHRPVRADQMKRANVPVPEGYEEKDVAEGDICVDTLSPFEFFPDPLARSMEELEWAVECKVRSPEYVRKRYPKADPTPDAHASLGISESRLIGPGAFAPTATMPQSYQGVRVFELWQRPNRDHPQGFRVTWCNDTVLATDEAPFDPMPYVMFGGTRAPGRFWPTCVTSQLRGPQTELNKIKSQIRETANRIGNPALLWSRFNGDCEYEGIPGQIVTFDDTGGPNSKPDFLRPPEMPMYVQNEVERIEASIQEISGLHEVSKATVPAGVTAASAINLLQEADDTRLGPEVQDLEESLAQAGDKILRLRAKFTDTAKMIRIGGEDGDWDIREYRGNVLSDTKNVEVQGGSMMPRSKAAKQAAMTEVFSLILQYAPLGGIVLDQRAMRGFFRDYEAGAIDKLFSTVAPDENQVIRENRMLSQGIALNINSFDNDDIHIAGHETFQKGNKWLKLEPQKQALFQLHVDAHRERRIETTQRQVQDQSQGAAGAEQMKQQGELAVGQQKIEGGLAQKALEAAMQQSAQGAPNGAG